VEIAGLGTDLVDIDRFRSVLTRTPTIVGRLFTDAERGYCEGFKDPAPRFAVRFAAKEAVLKSLGLGLFELPIRQIEVVTLPSGEPQVRVHERAAQATADKGVSGFKVSLTHTDHAAHAMVLAIGATGATDSTEP
jgi:holo-[acyl-carrier protein] synthase